MSEHENLSAVDDPGGLDESASAADASGGWSPVMGTPPPEADTAVALIDPVPPHEAAEAELVPPPPLDDLGGDLTPPPLPEDLGDEMPPVAPLDDPVDLGGDVTLDQAPMPPVEGDTDLAPPAPGTTDGIDFGDGRPVAPVVDDDPTTDSTTDPQTPVPTMGTPAPTGEVELPTDEPLVPAGPGDTTDTETVDTTTDTGDTDPDGDPALEGVPVNPGEERITAAALTGWYLDELAVNDPLREEMIDLLEQYAQDGEITIDELDAAFMEAGLVTTTDGTEEQLVDIVNRPEQTAVIGSTPDEGTGVYRLTQGDGVIEVQSVRTRTVYAAEPQVIAQAWRDSGSRIVSAPADDLAAADVADAEPAAAVDGDGDGSQLRDVLVAGAVLLPMAGGGAYLATRKLR